MSAFERRARSAWRADPNRPERCTCVPRALLGPDDCVLLWHRDWCALYRLIDAKPNAVVLSVRDAGYGGER